MTARRLSAALAGLALAALAPWVAPAAAKTLVFCSDGTPDSLNPEVVYTVTGQAATEPMFDGLVRFDDHGAILPSLAESWTISPDGRAYTFHLRHGVKFHRNAFFTPTRDFDADDLLFSFDRQWHESNPYHHLAEGKFTYFEDMEMDRLLEGIDRLDDATVRFRLTRAEAPFLADLAMPLAKVLSAEYAEAMLKAGTPERLDAEPIGTGPFSFDGYQKGVTVRFKAFLDHWAGRPPLDTLVFSITPNASVRLTKLKAGECQVAQYPNPSDADRIENDPHLALQRTEGLNVGYMAMNASRPPFDDVRVRRAVNLAVDKDAIVHAIYGRLGTPAKNPLPPMLWSYDDAIVPYPYDPAAAQRLMQEAGHADGFDTDIWYMPVTRPYNPDSKRMAEMVADDLSHIGIRAHLVTVPWAEYSAKLLAGQANLSFLGWNGDNGDPDNFLGILLGCRDGEPFSSNVAKWCDPAYDALISKAKATTDHEERAELYRQAQVIAHAEAPWVPIAHSIVLTAIRREVHGFKLNLFGRYLFNEADLDGN